MERRFIGEFRADLSGRRLTGHAAVFGQEARIRDFYEVIHPDAFTRALAEKQDVVLLANHEGLPLARTSSGTLELGVDARGLPMAAELPDTSLGRDVAELTRRGDLRSMSFGFVVRDEAWSERKGGGQLRTIRDVDLFDVSVVTFPAYAGTDLALRYAAHLGDIPSPPQTVPRASARGQAALIRARLKV